MSPDVTPNYISLKVDQIKDIKESLSINFSLVS